MKVETICIQKDITIIGAGMPGICAAIQAARHGMTVALVNNRGVIGGNASPEIRIHVSGSSRSCEFNFYARESGILEELNLENLHRNPQGNVYLWHTVLLDYIYKEKNIQLFLNTNIDEVEMANKRKIKWVSGSQSGTEKRFIFESDFFLDDTGDGTVGYLAGASYRMGRESKKEFGERIAPDEADDNVILSTLSFYTKDTNRPAPFTLPEFANGMSVREALEHRQIPDRIPGDSRYEGYRIQWFYEVGYGYNQIKDAEEVIKSHNELVFGIWDHIKNSGKYDSGNYDFEYISNIPGKRESRRLMGDYILTENDVVSQKDFEDTIGYGGWSIDLHAMEGFFSNDTVNKHYILNGIYPIPLRCCYSESLDNLFVASRCMSTTHVAFGTTRVMATLGMLGQSVATAAYLCKKHNTTPQGIFKSYIPELQQMLLKEDQYIIGKKNEDRNDLAKNAIISASSWQDIMIEEIQNSMKLKDDTALILPVEKATKKIYLLLKADKDTNLYVKFKSPTKDQNYKPQKLLLEVNIDIKKSDNYNWVEIPLLNEFSGNKLFIELKSNLDISLAINNDRINGLFFLKKDDVAISANHIEIETLKIKENVWSLQNYLPCLKLDYLSNIYGPDKIINGYSRNHGLPNIWLSDKNDKQPVLTMKFENPTTVKEIYIVFDSNLNFYYDNMEIFYNFNAFPEVVKDYSVYAIINNKKTLIASVENNYQRVNHLYVDNVITNELFFVFKSTNGAPRTGVYEIRLY